MIEPTLAWLLSLYDEIWLQDFEFISKPGERPDVVCLVAHELRSGRTLRLWHDELGEQPPSASGPGKAFPSERMTRPEFRPFRVTTR